MGITLNDIAEQRAMLARGEEKRKADWKQAERERLRDTFAAAALTGMMSRVAGKAESFAEAAYKLADAMLRERERTTEESPDVQTNLDAVPAAIAPADSHAPRGAVDRKSVGTDKAEPLNRDCSTGNTNARLAALEELSALDQELELKHGIKGNPMIKARQRTQQPHATPTHGSVQDEGGFLDSRNAKEPVAWAVAAGNGEYAVRLFSGEADARLEVERRAVVGLRSDYVVVPLYRHAQPAWACLNEETVSLRAEITRLKATAAKLWDIAASSIDPPERRRMLDRLGMDSFSEDG